MKDIDFRHLIDSITSVWRKFLPREIHLNVRHAPDLWCGATDAAHLEAVILDLLLNARDAMPKGGELTIETENLASDFGLVRAQHGLAVSRYVIISVSNNGSGKPAEVTNTACNSLAATKATGKGAGRDLGRAYGSIRQSGGFLCFESNTGQGTTVRIFLPVAVDTPVIHSTTKQPCRAKDDGHRVLVVDDDPLVRDYVQALLSSLKYEVTMATNGPDALRCLAADSKIDLLFTDIRMEGGMNGWELARRAQALYPSLPVLFTSGDLDPAEATSDKAAGVRRLLRKPYRARDLSAAVRDAISAKSAPEP